MDSTDPDDPIDSTDPDEPMDRIDPVDPTDSALPRLSTLKNDRVDSTDHADSALPHESLDNQDRLLTSEPTHDSTFTNSSCMTAKSGLTPVHISTPRIA